MQEDLAVPQLASPLAYFFISPENSPSLPFPQSIVHCIMLYLTPPCICTCTHAYTRTLSSAEFFMSIAASFGNRNSRKTGAIALHAVLDGKNWTEAESVRKDKPSIS